MNERPASIRTAASCVDGYDPDALPVEAACAAIRACLVPVAARERVAVRAALGRVLAEDVVPGFDVPAHDNSAMDGWAVRAADLAANGDTTLEEIGTALAGRAFDGAPGTGQCVRVMTGAVMPKGADCVVVQEVVREEIRAEGKRIFIPPGQKRGQNVRAAGEDLKTGVPVLRPGRALAPADLGLMASLGLSEVTVRRKLRVAFFSTGDELASVGTPLAPGQVYDSNRYTLYGMLARLGVEAIDMGVVRDEPAKLEAAFRDAAACADAIVTSGGVSVGEADFTRTMMARLGEVLFWRIAMRPGRPMAFGRINDAMLFGLPGNPVAVMVTFYQFVREALLAMAGRTGDTALPMLAAAAAHPMRKVPGRTEYQRGIVFREDGVWKARSTGQQGSGVLRSMSEANCFIVLEHARGRVEAGEPVQIQLFDGLL